MKEALILFLENLTGNDYLTTILISMFPLIELKGAIPIGTALGENLLVSFLLSYLGSTIISIPIFFLLNPIFNLLKKIPLIKKLVERIELVIERRAKKISGEADNKDNRERWITKALLIFVAVPFPVTGVWTGTAIASFLKLKFKSTILAVSVGNLIAGAIITLLTFFFKDYVDIIIYSLFLVIIVMIIITILKIIFTKKESDS